jgi:hypothetical protein
LQSPSPPQSEAAKRDLELADVRTRKLESDATAALGEKFEMRRALDAAQREVASLGDIMALRDALIADLKAQCANHESALAAMRKREDEAALSAHATARDNANAASSSSSSSSSTSSNANSGDANDAQIISALRKKNVRLRALCALFRARAIVRRVADRRWARAVGDGSVVPAGAATQVRVGVFTRSVCLFDCEWLIWIE